MVPRAQHSSRRELTKGTGITQGGISCVYERAAWGAEYPGVYWGVSQGLNRETWGEAWGMVQGLNSEGVRRETGAAGGGNRKPEATGQSSAQVASS